MTSKRTVQPAHSRWNASHASAARRTRRTFSGVDHLERVAESVPVFDFTSQKTTVRAATRDDVELVAGDPARSSSRMR